MDLEIAKGVLPRESRQSGQASVPPKNLTVEKETGDRMRGERKGFGEKARGGSVLGPFSKLVLTQTKWRDRGRGVNYRGRRLGSS